MTKLPQLLSHNRNMLQEKSYTKSLLVSVQLKWNKILLVAKIISFHFRRGSTLK